MLELPLCAKVYFSPQDSKPCSWLQALRSLKFRAPKNHKSKIFHEQQGSNKQPVPHPTSRDEGSPGRMAASPPPAVHGELPSIPDDYDVTLVNVAIATMLSEIQINSISMTVTIYNFLQRSYELAKWSPEATIAACVLVLRWVKSGNGFNPQTWKRVLLVALLVGQKITDDIPLHNGEFCTIWQSVSEDPCLMTPLEVARLEKNFVHSLDWHVFVDSRTMTMVYHELIALVNIEQEHEGL